MLPGIIFITDFWSTLIACLEQIIELKLFIESIYYLVKVAYFYSGSIALEEKVRKAVKKTNILFLKNHGIIVFDDSVEGIESNGHNLVTYASID